jgi:hypothetical protein
MNRALYATTTAFAAVLASLFFAMGTAAAATPAPASASSMHLNRHHDWDDWGHHHHVHLRGHWHYHGYYRGGAPSYDDYYARDSRAGVSSLASRYFGVYADANVVHDFPSDYTNCENEPGPGVSKWACTHKKFTVPPAQQ